MTYVVALNPTSYPSATLNNKPGAQLNAVVEFHETMAPMDDAPRSGTITKIETQRRNPDRVSVYVDGSFALGVHRDVWRASELEEGQHLDEETWMQLVQADGAVVARQRALDYLARRGRSVEEMRRYLRRKEFEDVVIEDVIHELQDEGRLDDEAYARAFAEERFRLKGHGPVRIESDLRQRGVARWHIAAAIEHIRDRDKLRTAAQEHAEQRWDYLVDRESDPRKRRKKMYDYLRRRGFSYDLIREVVEAVETRHAESS